MCLSLLICSALIAGCFEAREIACVGRHGNVHSVWGFVFGYETYLKVYGDSKKGPKIYFELSQLKTKAYVS